MGDARDGLITPEWLKILGEPVLQFTHFSAHSLPGLSNERKEVIVPELAILCGVINALVIKKLKLSDFALREGVLYEMAGRFCHQDIRMRTAKRLAEYYNIDNVQNLWVWETTDTLYQQWWAQNALLKQMLLAALLK